MPTDAYAFVRIVGILREFNAMTREVSDMTPNFFTETYDFFAGTKTISATLMGIMIKKRIQLPPVPSIIFYHRSTFHRM